MKSFAVNFDAFIEALTLFLAAAGAFISRRNQRELKPKKTSKRRVKQLRGGKVITVNGISIKDLAVNVLEEVNNLHRRLDKVGIAPLERDGDV